MGSTGAIQKTSKSNGIVRNNSIATFFLLARYVKLARNRTFDHKEHKEVVSEPEQNEVVVGHYRDSSHALIGQ